MGRCDLCGAWVVPILRGGEPSGLWACGRHPSDGLARHKHSFDHFEPYACCIGVPDGGSPTEGETVYCTSAEARHSPSLSGLLLVRKSF
jgi:hypothetical protein